MRLTKSPKGIPNHEVYPSLADEEINDLIRRYREQRRKEQLFKFGNKEITKSKIKRALPMTSKAISNVLSNTHSLNPHNRESLLKTIRKVNSTPENEF